MRLAIITSHPIQYYAPLFRELAKRCELHVFYAHNTTAAEQAAAGYGTAFDWDIDLLSGYAHSFLKNVAQMPGTDRFAGCDTPGIAQALASQRFDVLMMTGWNLKCYWQGLWAAKWAGIPVMVRGDSQLASPRGPLKQFAKRLTYPSGLRLFAAGLYVGQRNKSYWQHYKFPENRLFHSPHCVDTLFFASHANAAAGLQTRDRLGIKPESRLALFVGRMIGFKRLEDVIQALAKLRHQGQMIELLAVGAGDRAATWAEQARQQGVPIHMPGFQNQSCMPGIYAAADVLVLPSDSAETWGLVANEALASGCPVIVSNAIGSAPDLAMGPCAARLYQIGEIDELARKIREVVTNPPTSQQIAELSQFFSPNKAADGIMDAIFECSQRL